jgi:hypothetical protein
MRGRPRKNNIPDDKVALVADQYRHGASFRELAHKYNVTPYVIKEALLDMGVKIRRQGRRKVGKLVLSPAAKRGVMINFPDIKEVRLHRPASGQAFMDLTDDGEN